MFGLSCNTCPLLNFVLCYEYCQKHNHLPLPACTIACINIYVHIKNPRHCKLYHHLETIIGEDSTALVAAVTARNNEVFLFF